MSDNCAVGDRVVALVAMSKAIRPGVSGVVTSESKAGGVVGLFPRHVAAGPHSPRRCPEGRESSLVVRERSCNRSLAA